GHELAVAGADRQPGAQLIGVGELLLPVVQSVQQGEEQPVKLRAARLAPLEVQRFADLHLLDLAAEPGPGSRAFLAEPFELAGFALDDDDLAHTATLTISSSTATAIAQ